MKKKKVYYILLGKYKDKEDGKLYSNFVQQVQIGLNEVKRGGHLYEVYDNILTALLYIRKTSNLINFDMLFEVEVIGNLKHRSYAKKIIIHNEVTENYIEKLCDNEKFIKESFNKNMHTFKFASKRLKEKKNMVDYVVAKNGYVFQYLSEKYKNNKRVLELALKTNPHAPCFASDRLKKDKHLIKKYLSKENIQYFYGYFHDLINKRR
jgi:hypothetical protein